jgi:aspartyl aminopeptidase
MDLAHKAMGYINAGSDPFHVVQASIERLEAAGFIELREGEPFYPQLKAGGRYYYTRNRSTLVAFCVGGEVRAGIPPGFKVIGGHTDSPNLRVKPRSKRSSSGCAQIGVECYGGGLWHTWFDRDLGVSGRVLVRKRSDSSSSGGDGGGSGAEGAIIEQRLVKIDRALLRISNLAIHLQTAKEREAFAVNKEDHLSPILAMAAEKALSGPGDSVTSEEGTDNSTSSNDGASPSTKTPKDGWTEHQEPALLQILAHELGVREADICDFELSLFDVQKASIGGAFGEFLHSARLDNLASCFLAVQALTEYVQDESAIAKDPDVSVIVLYDHEEVGSASAVGAASPIMGEAVRRISSALNNGIESTDWYQACAHRSFVLSSDQAHAVHPNYSGKHEKVHQPKMNQGMVIKRNSNQRYATNTVTGFLIREVARRAGIRAPQEFVVRQDCGCGSTIGPLISTATGIRAVDMGCPQVRSSAACGSLVVMERCSRSLRSHTLLFSSYRCIRSVKRWGYATSPTAFPYSRLSFPTFGKSMIASTNDDEQGSWLL